MMLALAIVYAVAALRDFDNVDTGVTISYADQSDIDKNQLLPRTLCPTPEVFTTDSEVDKLCNKVPAALKDCKQLVQQSDVPTDLLCAFMREQATLRCADVLYKKASTAIQQEGKIGCEQARVDCLDEPEREVMSCFVAKFSDVKQRAMEEQTNAERAKKERIASSEVKMKDLQKKISQVYEKAEVSRVMQGINDVLESTRRKMQEKIVNLPKELADVEDTVPAYLDRLEEAVSQQVKDMPTSTGGHKKDEPSPGLSKRTVGDIQRVKVTTKPEVKSLTELRIETEQKARDKVIKELDDQHKKEEEEKRRRNDDRFEKAKQELDREAKEKAEAQRSMLEEKYRQEYEATLMQQRGAQSSKRRRRGAAYEEDEYSGRSKSHSSGSSRRRRQDSDSSSD